MSASRVKIVEKGWENYNGHLCGDYEFIEGTSVEKMTLKDQLVIGSSIQVVSLDDDDNEVEQVGAAADLQNWREADAEHTNAEQKRLEKEAVVQAKKAAVEKVEKKVDNGAYAYDQLKHIANTKGMTGLREIALEVDPSGETKARSTANLVKKIMDFQGKNLKKAKKDAPKVVAEKEAAAKDEVEQAAKVAADAEAADAPRNAEVVKAVAESVVAKASVEKEVAEQKIAAAEVAG